MDGKANQGVAMEAWRNSLLDEATHLFFDMRMFLTERVEDDEGYGTNGAVSILSQRSARAMENGRDPVHFADVDDEENVWSAEVILLLLFGKARVVCVLPLHGIDEHTPRLTVNEADFVDRGVLKLEESALS